MQAWNGKLFNLILQEFRIGGSVAEIDMVEGKTGQITVKFINVC